MDSTTLHAMRTHRLRHDETTRRIHENNNYKVIAVNILLCVHTNLYTYVLWSKKQ